MFFLPHVGLSKTIFKNITNHKPFARIILTDLVLITC